MSSAKKVALVTGAFGGIGQAIAIRLAADGHIVIATDLNTPDDTVTQIVEAGGDAVAYELDVTKAADWDRVVNATIEKYGAVDYLAASAGVVNRWSADTAVDLTEEAWDKVLDVDAKGVWLGMKAVIPNMIARGGGRIVNISSLAAHKGLQGLASYSAAKGAVEALSRQVAVEYGRKGVLVNVVAPGTIETTINAATLADPVAGAASAATTTLGRWGQVHELAAAVSFLLNEGSFVSGQVYLVDGGWSISGGVEYGDSRTM